MRPRVNCKVTSEEHAKQKKDGMRLCNAEKDLPKVHSTVVFLMHSEWSGLSLFAHFRYVIFFLVNLLVVYSNKIHMHDTLDRMHGL